ncbi:MAG: hypothetical protein ACRCYY_11530 [Trueperaceae bacterium]
MTATDFERRKAGFLKQPLPRRLGNLAVNVKRITAHADDTTKEGALFWLVETRHLAEWSKVDASEKLQTDLSHLVEQLSEWESTWNEIWLDSQKKSEIETLAKSWSESLYEKMDELLAVKV